MFNGGYTRDNMFGLQLDYPEFLKQLAEQLLKAPKRRLLLIPHTFAPKGSVESDPHACEIQATNSATAAPAIETRQSTGSTSGRGSNNESNRIGSAAATTIAARSA
jgi:hypothetical protein